MSLLPFDPQPVVLSGRSVRLEPLEPRHGDELFAAQRADPSIWRYMTMPEFTDRDVVQSWIQSVLRESQFGAAVPFAILEAGSRRAVGSTRYFDIRRPVRGLEIGWTWLGRPWQRTAINTEAKYLLLRHAFDDLGAYRVQFKTDGRNLQSQKALARIGAVAEGTLRRQRLCPDGEVRDSVYFAVTDGDWPRVRAHLEALLAPAVA